MKLKRILSFAVALSMILSIVPAFSLTASAESLNSDAELIYDGSFGSGATTYSVEFTAGGSGFGFKDVGMIDNSGNIVGGFCYAGPGDGIYPGDGERNVGPSSGFSRTSGDNGHGQRWTSGQSRIKITFDITSANTYDIIYSIDGTEWHRLSYSGTPDGITHPSLWRTTGAQNGGASPTYGDVVITVDGETVYDERNPVAYALAATWYAIEFTLATGHNNGTGDYKDYYVKDSNENQFTGFCYAGPGDGFYPEDRQQLSSGFSMATTNKDISSHWTSYSSKMRIAVTIQSDTSYKVTYTIIDGANETELGNYIYSGSPKGIMLPWQWKTSGGGGGTFGFVAPKIYAVIPQTSVTVTATYTAGGETVLTKTDVYDTAKGETGANFPEFYYSAQGSGDMYYAAATTISEDSTITMTKIDNWSTKSAGDDLSDTYSPGKFYKIASGVNIVPNGNFEYGMEGWYARDGIVPAVYSVVTDNKPAASDRAAMSSGNGGGSGNSTLSRQWPVTKGSTYYYSFWMYSGDGNNGFGNSTGAGKESYDIVGNGLPGGSGGLGEDTGREWKKFEGVFTATEDYVSFHEAWSSLGVADFEIYEVTEYQPAVSTEGTYKVALDALTAALPMSTRTDVTLPTSTTDSLGTAISVTWTTTDENVMSNSGVVANLKQPASVEVTPTAKFGDATVTGESKTIWVFPKSVGDGVTAYEVNGTYYDIAAQTNLITNGSFENGTANWESHMAQADPNKIFQGAWYDVTETGATAFNDPNKHASNYSEGPIPEGEHALGSMWKDKLDSGNYCTIDTMWQVQKTGKYYFSFYSRSVEGNGNIYAYVSKTGDKHRSNAALFAEDQITGNIDSGNKKNWQKFEFVFDVNAGEYVGFTAFELPSTDNRVGILFDDFELYEATKAATGTAELYLQGTDTLLAVKEGLNGADVTFTPGIYAGSDNRAYEVTESSTATASLDGTRVYVTGTDMGLAPIDSFSWEIGAAAPEYSDEGDYTALKENSMYVVPWGPGGAAGSRVGVMEFEVPDITSEDYMAEAYLNLNLGFVRDGQKANVVIYGVQSHRVDNGQLIDAAKTTNIHDFLDSVEAVEIASVALGEDAGRKNIKVALRNYFTIWPSDRHLALIITSSGGAMAFNNLKENDKGLVSVPYISYRLADFDANKYTLGGYIMKNNVGNNTKLNDIFMLGAHDSMTAEMGETMDPGQQKSEDAVANIADWGDTKYYQTQLVTFTDLLSRGVRYIDLRLTRGDGTTNGSKDNEFYATHTKIAGKFGSTDGDPSGSDPNREDDICFAQEIVNWLHDNPGEILIIDFQKVYDYKVDFGKTASGENDNRNGYSNQATFDDIKSILVNTKDVDGRSLYSYFYNATGKHPSDLTYGQVTLNGVRAAAIGLCLADVTNRSNSRTAAIDKFMWRSFYNSSAFTSDNNIDYSATVWSEWPEQADVNAWSVGLISPDRFPGLIGKLDEIAAKRNSGMDNKFRIMQGVLSTYFGGLSRYKLVDILGTADNTNSTIYSHENFTTWLNEMPIFMLDKAGTKDVNVKSRTSTYDLDEANVNVSNVQVNGTGDFNTVVTVDLARYNRNVANGFTGTAAFTDHTITFKDSETNPKVLVKGSNFKLPISIRLDATVKSEADVPAAPATVTVDGKELAVSEVKGIYKTTFNHFIRKFNDDPALGELGSQVSIGFAENPDTENNTIQVLKLNAAGNGWELAESTNAYDNDVQSNVATLKQTTSVLNGTYMVVELDVEKANVTFRYHDDAANFTVDSEPTPYVVGTTATAPAGEYYVQIRDDAYIINNSEAKSSIVPETDIVVDVPVTLISKYASVSDDFATNDSNKKTNDTVDLVFAGASGLSVASYRDADGNATTTKPEGQGGLGSPRVGLITFRRPAVEDGQAVTLKAYVANINQNLGTGTNMKLAVIPHDDMVVEEAKGHLAANYAYDNSKAIWSKEPVTSHEVGAGGRDICNEWIEFDVTEAIKSASGEYITFAFYAPSAGAYIADREKAVFEGEFQGKAAYLDFVDAKTVTFTAGAAKVTKAGTNVTDYAETGIVVADGYTLKVTPSDASIVAFADAEGNVVYNASKAIAPTDDVELSPKSLGLVTVNGAQVRIGDGTKEDGTVSDESGLRFITLLNKTDTLAGFVENEDTLNKATLGVRITAEGSDRAVNVDVARWQDNDHTIFTTALTKLIESNFNRYYTETPYLEIAGETYYGTPITRSVYQVAAGLLKNGYTKDDNGTVVPGKDGEIPDPTGTDYSEMPQVLVNVLNAYVNQVGIRLNLTSAGVFSARIYDAENETATKGGYRGTDAFFEITDCVKSGNTYTCTLKPYGEAVINTDTEFYQQRIRINNNNAQISTKVTITENEDGTYSLEFTL